MRFTLSFVTTLVVLGSGLLAAALPTPGIDASATLGGYTINVDGSVSRIGSSEHLDPASLTPSATKRNPTPALPQTNAERLARGIPLKKPRMRGYARAPAASPVQGYIQVKNRDTGAVLGYVSSTQTGLGNYGNYAPDTSTALHIQLPVASGSQISVLTLNGPSAGSPYFGGVTGAASSSNNINVGSYNYIFLSGTSETAPGAVPQTLQTATTTYRGSSISGVRIESAIWSYDVSSGSLSPFWIDTDGSSHTGTLLRQAIGANSFFALTGDYNAYYSNFGSQGGITPVTFTFVLG